MSVLKRNMFNGGGYAHRGTGITSGLTPVRMHEGGELGHSHKKTQKDFLEENREILSEYYEPQGKQSRLKAASPALLALSAALLSGKSYQGGVSGALEILGQGLEKSTPYFDDVIKTRRSEKNAARKEQLTMDLKALDYARQDMKEYEAKLKPLQLGDSTLRWNPETDAYDTIAKKPSKLIEAWDSAAADGGANVFVPESLVRADMELSAIDPTHTPRFEVKRTIQKEDIVEAYDTTLKKFTWVPKDVLLDQAKKSALDPNYKPRYNPQGPDTGFTTVWSSDLGMNVLVMNSEVLADVNTGGNKYSAEKTGMDTFKEVYSKTLKTNLYVKQGDLFSDSQKNISLREYQSPKDDPEYKTYWEPQLKINILATDDEVTERLNDKDPDNDLEPKHAEYKDRIITLWSINDKRNILVNEKEALANTGLFEPEHKNDTTKSAIDTETDELVFVTNKDIVEGKGRYIPAILGQELVVGADGQVTMKTKLLGTAAADATSMQKENLQILEGIVLTSNELHEELLNEDLAYAFGVSGALLDFSNKYLAQIPFVPFNKAAADIRLDVNALGLRVMRLVTDDRRFTNEDRAYINRITGVAAMDAAQSYEQVVAAVEKITSLLEDRLTEAAGVMGKKPSYDMSIEELAFAYNNFRLDNNINWKGKKDYVRRTDLPSFNGAQWYRRMRLYFPDKLAKWEAKVASGEYK